MAPSQVRITRFSLGKLLDKVVLVGWVLFKLVGYSVKGSWWLIHAPIARVLTLVATLSLVAWWQLGGWAAFLPPLLALGGLAAWFLLRPLDFTAYWRAQYRYHFHLAPKWNEAMRAARLLSTDQKNPDRLSKIIGVWGNEHCDFVEVQMLPYQTPVLYQKRIDGIRRHLEYVGGRAVESKHAVNHVTLWLWKSDPLRKIVEPYKPRLAPDAFRNADSVDGDWESWFSQGLPIGRLEDGSPFNLDIVTTPFHWLISGITGSGKSGALWAFLWAAQHAIRRKGQTSGGAMIVDAIDPAMGMELTAGDEAGLFQNFIKAELPAWFTKLSEAEQEEWLADHDHNKLDPDFEARCAAYFRKTRIAMQVRGSKLLGKARKYTISEATPVHITVVDEIASLLSEASAASSTFRKQIAADLSEIMRQGRKFGYMIIGAVQNPLKEQVSLRDLFSYFTGFRLASKTATDIIFGTGAWDSGAHCPQIPRWMQGTCYTGNDFAPAEESEVEVSMDEEFDRVIRMRVCCVTDDHIRTLKQNDYEKAA